MVSLVVRNSNVVIIFVNFNAIEKVSARMLPRRVLSYVEESDNHVNIHVTIR